MRFIILLISTIVLGQDFYYNNNKKIYLTPINPHYSSSFESKETPKELIFQNPNSQILKTDGTIIITLKNGVDLDDFLTRYQLTLIKNIPNRYILVKSKNINSILETSQKIYKDKDVKVSSINFKKKYFKR